MKRMKLATIEKWTIDISSFSVFMLMMLTVIDVIGRYFLNHPLKGNVEISELLLMISMLLPIAAIQRRGEHIGVDIITNWLERYHLSTYHYLQFLCLILGVIVFVFALIYCLIDLRSSMSIAETTRGPLYVVVWPTKAVICVGLLIMNFRLLVQAIEAIKSALSGSKK